MQIIKVKAEKFNVGLSESFSYSLATLTELPYVLISIVLKNGIVGFGEVAASLDATGEIQDGSMQAFSAIEKLLRRQDIGSVKDIDKVMQGINTTVCGNPALKAGIEASLFDALGKLKKQPVSKMLGGKKKKYIILQKTFSFEDQRKENFPAALNKAKDGGVKVFKFKVNGNIDNTVKILEIFSKIAGREKIVLDVNQGWENAKKAIPIIKKIGKYQIAWIEQPIYYADFAGMAEIRKKTKIPIMADESCHNLLDLENLYLRKSIDMINIKLAKCGGILEAKKMISFCESNKIRYMLGDMLHSSLGTAANLHAATLGDFVSYDLTLPGRIQNDPFKGLIFDGFKAYIPSGWGLGVEESN